MNVLVVGAKGMLGHALVRVFRGDTVTAWDRDELDITKQEQVTHMLTHLHPDVVINAAAYTNVEKAEEEQERAMLLNGDAVGFLATTCKKLSIPLVHISTDYVFGENREEGYTETDVPTAPLNAYGASKLKGEELLKENTDMFWLVRAAWLYGPYGKNFVETMLVLGAEKKELRVVSDQHGSPTYTVDLASAIYTLVTEKALFGVYHFTNSGVTTWADFAQKIFEKADMSTRVVPVPTHEYETKVHRPNWSTLKNTKRPSLPSWEDALTRYLQHRLLPDPFSGDVV